MLSVRNAEFVLALLLLFLFLCTEKYLELKISNLCLLCFVCLFMKNCRDFGQRTLAPIPWGLFMFIARYCLTPRVLLLFLFRPREEWEKLIWNPLRLRRQQHRLWISSLNARKTQVSFYEWISWAQGIYRIPTTLSRGLCSVTKNGFVFP